MMMWINDSPKSTKTNQSLGENALLIDFVEAPHHGHFNIRQDVKHAIVLALAPMFATSSAASSSTDDSERAAD
jgi:hypothetical protein